MFRVCRAFLSVHAALWSRAGKRLTSLVFSSVPTNFADVYYCLSQNYVKVCRGCTGTIYTGITKDDRANIKQYIWIQPQQILAQFFNAVKHFFKYFLCFNNCRTYGEDLVI